MKDLPIIILDYSSYKEVIHDVSITVNHLIVYSIGYNKYIEISSILFICYLYKQNHVSGIFWYGKCLGVICFVNDIHSKTHPLVAYLSKNIYW